MILRRDSVNNDDLKRLPQDVVMKILKFHPLIIPPFTNNVLRRAVKDYIAGGDRKQRIVDKYGEISNWDVSKVTDMSRMFAGAESFNQPLNNWDVSNVEYMYGMFSGATSFNQPLDNWNVSNVTDMSDMFGDAKSFNQPLNKWNVSNITTMLHMFACATSFNQPLDEWNVSKVTTMHGMFYHASSFNQPLHAPWAPATPRIPHPTPNNY